MMWRRMKVVVLLALAVVFMLVGCGGAEQDPAVPTTETMLGGGVRPYCVNGEACPQSFVYQFNDILFYDDAANLPDMPIDGESHIIMAWVPASGRLYVNEEYIDPLSDEAQLDAAEFWSMYVLTARAFLPEPNTTNAATADLAVVQSPGETINEVVVFTNAAGTPASWDELNIAMADAGDDSAGLTAAQILFGVADSGNTQNTLVVFDESIDGPDRGLRCRQNPTLAYWLRYCLGRQ